jgi:hypothetical protein
METTEKSAPTRTAPRAVAVLVAAATAALAAAPGPAGAATAPAAALPRLGTCTAGELCLWTRDDFAGERTTYELTGTGTDDCVALRDGVTALSLANRLGRPVTAYQSQECAETGEFETYPGTGTWVPDAPYRIRAFKVWEH